MKTTDQILKKILLPDNDDWSIEEVTCDDSTEEIRVRLSYCKPDIVVDGVQHRHVGAIHQCSEDL